MPNFGLVLAVLRRWADTKDLRALQYQVNHGCIAVRMRAYASCSDAPVRAK